MKISDISLRGKRVLLRVDFNVPLDDEQQIIDPSRIEAALPTIQYILHQGASLILMSHLGRPKGSRMDKYSLAPCALYLKKQHSLPIKMAQDCIGSETKAAALQLKPGELLLLENLRFHAAEEKPEQDPDFAKQLAELGEFYVNDAFGTAHRKHSSTYTIVSYFPKKCAAGFLLEKEVQFLKDTLENPSRPFYALVGGAKISTKLAVLRSLLEKVDALFIGGAMSYTFLKYKNISIGKSLFEADLLSEAGAIIERAQKRGVSLFLPIDIRVLTSKDRSRIVNVNEGLAPEEEGMDIGPDTIKLYSDQLRKAKTLFWNGPFGRYEEERFAQGTLALLKQVASLNATTIIGGGDLVAATMKANLSNRMSHISTGGGATLELIEKGTLPALEALRQYG